MDKISDDLNEYGSFVHIEEVCKRCKKNCAGELQIDPSLLKEWNLPQPMHFICTLENIIEDKIKEFFHKKENHTDEND